MEVAWNLLINDFKGHFNVKINHTIFIIQSLCVLGSK